MRSPPPAPVRPCRHSLRIRGGIAGCPIPLRSTGWGTDGTRRADHNPNRPRRQVEIRKNPKQTVAAVSSRCSVTNPPPRFRTFVGFRGRKRLGQAERGWDAPRRRRLPACPAGFCFSSLYSCSPFRRRCENKGTEESEVSELAPIVVSSRLIEVSCRAHGCCCGFGGLSGEGPGRARLIENTQRIGSVSPCVGQPV